MKDAKVLAEDLKKQLSDSNDIIIRKVPIKNKDAYLVFIEEIVDAVLINQNIINAISTQLKDQATITSKVIMNKLSTINKVNLTTDINSIPEEILKGNAALIISGQSEIILFSVAKFEGRAIAEPPTSAVIKGPREGFTENIKTNIGLIRKRIHSRSLKIENFNVGRRTSTAVNVVYLSDLADSEVVDEICKRINEIDIDGILDSYYISEFLEQRPFSMFKQVGTSEKPDIICAKVLEGRIAVFVDGSPIVLTLPFLMFEDVQSANDYYTETYRASTLRMLRLIGTIASVLLPGLYIALVLYHYKLLPLKFLVTVVNSTQNLPLNPVLEIFLILVLFEILFEASIRMPKYLGIAISIVGALILGDTAVKAGLVSPPSVMIVAVSGITIYLIPDQSAQMSLLRFFFTLIGGLLGVLGILLGCVVVISYLCNFDNYKTPYLAPYVPKVASDRKDFVIKKDLLFMLKRPKSFPHKNENRMKNKDKKRIEDE